MLQVLSDFGYDRRKSNVYFQCFEPAELKRVRNELKCDLNLVQLLGTGSANGTDYDQLMTAEGLQQVASYADGIGPSFDSLYRVVDGLVSATEVVANAHSAGLVVHPYTLRNDSLPDGFDRPEEVCEFLVRNRIDGVFSDFPDTTKSGLKLLQK